jgi:hypothetical protein
VSLVAADGRGWGTGAYSPSQNALRVARAVLGVGDVGGDEEELAVDDRDFVAVDGMPI